MRFKGYPSKTVITLAGDVTVQRRYYACPECGTTRTPWDRWAGLESHHLTPSTKRLAVLAGSSWSYDVASVRLKEFCGVRISDQTIRRVTDSTGAGAKCWLNASQAVGDSFRSAEGQAEFYTDGTCVNTRSGWREMRVGVFAKRPAGSPASPEEWADRKLPSVTSRVAFGGISDSATFGATWERMVAHLGLEDEDELSVLADGAKWIWRQVRERLPCGECVVDIFHVSEHLHECGRSLHGEQTPAAREWAEGCLEELIGEGPVAFLKRLEEERRTQRSPRKRKALDGLMGYLRSNVDGLWYGSRLSRGLPIGSGLVEGACKTVIGRRLKCNGARWHVEAADNMAALRALLYSDLWDTFWQHAAA